jgi:hypothetical protein
MNHNRISALSTIFILAMVVLLAGTVPAMARAERIYYTGEDCPIYVGPRRGNGSAMGCCTRDVSK